MNCKLPSRLAMLTMLPMLLTLAGCPGLTLKEPDPIAQGPTSKPLACTEFAPMTFSTGKPGVTVADVAADLQKPDNPLGWARADLGDTMTTRAEISAYAAARKRLGCD